MKRTKIKLIILLLTVLQQISIAQTGNWKLAGNSLTGTEKLGSKNNFPINFITNNSTRMTLTTSGNVGIGTNAPEGNLHVFRGSAGSVSAFFNAPLVVENSTNNYINLLAPNANETGILFGKPESSISGGLIYNSSPTLNGLQFRTNGNFTRMVLTNAGNLGIGTVTPGANLHVVRGSAGVTPFFNAPVVVENSTHNYINLLAPDANETGILFGKPQSNVSGGLIYNSSPTTNGLQFRTNGNFTRMVLTNTGRVGIGTTAPATELHLVHGDEWFGKSGLRLQNSGANGVNWTLHTSNFDGKLYLFFRDDEVGHFHNISGEYFSGSDARRKKDIETAPDVLSKVLQLDVKKYHFLKNKPDDKKHYGMIAQEVEKIFPEVVYHNKMDGSEKDYYAMNYSAFGVLAIKAIQEQQQKITTLEDRIAEQQVIINDLKSSIDQLRQLISSGSQASSLDSKTTELSGARLIQNAPNPFRESTSINYYLPQNKNNATIEIVSANGQLIKSITLTQKGNGQISLNAGELSAGTYFYTLKVEGVKVDSKQMVLVK